MTQKKKKLSWFPDATHWAILVSCIISFAVQTTDLVVQKKGFVGSLRDYI